MRRVNVVRRLFSLAALSCLGGALLPASAQASAQGHSSSQLPVARSLKEELAAALKAGQPLVVMVSLAGCAYCDIVRNHYLLPLSQRGAFVVQVDWRSTMPLQDFVSSGSHDDAVRRWKVRVAPTLLFFGPGGREVAPRLAGVSSLDFYGAYLDARMEEARRAVRS